MSRKWIYQPASELTGKLRAGEIGSRDLLEAYIERVEEHNPAINAVVARNLEDARKHADQADQAIGRGEVLGRLHGLPLTIKDTWEVPGMACTAGAPLFRDHYPKSAAPAVKRLQNDGAIIFGKTNVPLFASDIQSYNRIYGTTNNPWDVRLTPGGSSGGAAAALAAGFTSLGLGSDLAGSIRIPAHYCGVYGHKPSHGVISLQGHIPGPLGTLGEPPLAVAGPMARSADDLELMLDILVGPSPELSPGWEVRLPPAGKESLRDYRVLMWTEDPMCPVDDSMQQQYRDLKQRLQEAGVKVDSGAPTDVDLEHLYATYMRQLGGVIGTANPKRL
ncbi:amidase family protein [Hahella ganghwensis]|uniref:amidase family protein n=1 Tax=Hahella ganghwensis TaxID=286420 RepID=UPI00037A1D08|nr:amidase family protein [Hahella ganghwensis]